MSDEIERAKEIDNAVKAADAKKRADAEEAANQGEKLDKVLECLDGLSKRMDAYDAGHKSEMEGEIEKDKPRELAADAQVIRKDSAADLEEIAHFAAETGAAYKIEADSVLAHIQSDADRASSAWGKSSPKPLDGETITAYRRRAARAHQSHSPAWKGVDLSALMESREFSDIRGLVHGFLSAG